MLYERMLSNLQSETIFLREQLKLKDDHFRDEISYLRKQLEECLHLSSLKRDDHDFVSYREILNLLLKKSIATTDEPPRDSNSINSINIHNNSNKGSAVTITNDDRDVNNNSVTETNKRESSNGDSNNNKSGRWDGNANKKAQSKNVSKKSETKKKIYILGDSMVKHIKGWDLSAKLDHHHNIYVRIFLELKLEV